MNTLINFLYRDADNYKKQNHVVVAGVFTDTQKETILDALEDGEYFIPEQVGLPAKRFEEYEYSALADHPYMELYSDGFKLTNAAPTCDLTPAQLVENFRKAEGNWDVDSFRGW